MEADEFAACLLMPEEEFKRQYKKYGDDYHALSKYFGTSKPSIGVRILRLGLDR